VKNLVSEEEISEVAKLMKIDLEDHSDHIKKVQKVIEWFDLVDKYTKSEMGSKFESEKINVQKIDLNNLRNDKHIPYDKNLLKFLKSYQEKYVKAPKLN
jgi:aspartyl-tRNA(Asn)/glutamyl-tRNA(Gln) amidotransferase subunit C